MRKLDRDEAKTGGIAMRKSVFTEKFKLDSEREKQVREEIKAFYLDTFDEEIGMIKEQQILDLFYEHMAPVIYNKALDDVHRWHRQQAENLESDYYMLYCDDTR